MLLPCILHYNTNELTTQLCKELPDAVVFSNTEEKELKVSNKVYVLGKNHGFSLGWNLGLQKVLIDYPNATHFWLCNSDIIPFKDCYSNLQECCENNPAFGIITPAYNCWIPSVRCDYSNKLKEISGVEITAPVLSRTFLNAICEKSAQGQTYLDHIHFNLGYGTEWDLAYRAKMKGYKVGVCHNANFYHISHQSIKNSIEYENSEHVYANEAWKEQISGFSKKYGKNIVNEICPKEEPNLNQRYAVYTTCFGDYDTVKEITPQSVDIDWYVICDRQPTFENEKAKKQWNIVTMDYPRIGNDRLNAKFYKLYPHECQQLLAHDYLIYIDLSIRIKNRDFVRYMLSNLSNKHFTIYKHPSGRTTIEQELQSSLYHGVAQKYKHLPIKKQVEFYIPFEKIPLAACGVFIRALKSQKINKVFNDWWWEIIKWSYQDQLSFPVICAFNNFVPEWFPENQSQNPYHETEWCSKP